MKKIKGSLLLALGVLLAGSTVGALSTLKDQPLAAKAANVDLTYADFEGTVQLSVQEKAMAVITLKNKNHAMFSEKGLSEDTTKWYNEVPNQIGNDNLYFNDLTFTQWWNTMALGSGNLDYLDVYNAAMPAGNGWGAFTPGVRGQSTIVYHVNIKYYDLTEIRFGFKAGYTHTDNGTTYQTATNLEFRLAPHLDDKETLTVVPVTQVTTKEAINVTDACAWDGEPEAGTNYKFFLFTLTISPHVGFYGSGWCLDHFTYFNNYISINGKKITWWNTAAGSYYTALDDGTLLPHDYTGAPIANANFQRPILLNFYADSASFVIRFNKDWLTHMGFNTSYLAVTFNKGFMYKNADGGISETTNDVTVYTGYTNQDMVVKHAAINLDSLDLVGDDGVNESSELLLYIEGSAVNLRTGSAKPVDPTALSGLVDNVTSHILIDGAVLPSVAQAAYSYDGKGRNYLGWATSFAAPLNKDTATPVVLTLKAGLAIPSYETTQGHALIMKVLPEDVAFTFAHNGTKWVQLTNVDTFSQLVLDCTSTECHFAAGEGYNSDLTTVWANLQEVHGIMAPADKTTLKTAANDGMARYDYLVLKYGLVDFLERNPISPTNMNMNVFHNDSAIIITMLTLMALLPALYFVKKRKAVK